MKNTYKILDKEEVLTNEEIRKKYDGYWVHVVKARMSDHGGLVMGIPVIIGLCESAGAESGIYEKYQNHEYDKRCDLNLLHDENLDILVGEIRQQLYDK